MPVAVSPSSPDVFEWIVHPTVVTQSGTGAAVIGQSVSNFAIGDAAFQSLIAGGGGLQPTILIDVRNAGRALVMPLISFSGSATFQFQILGWNYSIALNSWVCQAVTHSPTAINAANPSDSGGGIVLDFVTYQAFATLGVTTTAAADGDGGVVPLPSHYEIIPVEGLRGANATSLCASSAYIQVNNYGWQYLTVHLRQSAPVTYTCSFRCLYASCPQIFR